MKNGFPRSFPKLSKWTLNCYSFTKKKKITLTTWVKHCNNHLSKQNESFNQSLKHLNGIFKPTAVLSAFYGSLLKKVVALGPLLQVPIKVGFS